MNAAVVTTKGFDVLLVAHATLAITTLVVLLVLRAAARSARAGHELSDAARRSFTGRTELAGRVVHLVPLSGLGLVALSRGGYSLATPFVLVGLGAWAFAAGMLEGVAFPAQRAAAARLQAGEDPADDADKMTRGLELAALAVVAAGIVMIAAPAL